MRNQVAGSEAAFVKLCQSQGQNCIANSAKLISNYDLILLQEVSAAEWPNFLVHVQQLGKQRGSNYQGLISYYFGTWITAIIYDENVLGHGFQITPPLFELYEESSRQKTGSRGIIVVWFEKFSLIAINLHAPHNIHLKDTIEKRLRDSEPFLQKANIMKGGIKKEDIKRVIMGGDFNDDRSAVFKEDFSINAYGLRLKLPIAPDLIPKTCCFDSNYQYAGDYILDSRLLPLDQTKDEYFGVPMGYRRGIDLYSDHDPITYITHIDSSPLAAKKPIENELPTLKGTTARGRVRTSGSYVEIQFPTLNQDKLVLMAQRYVKEKKLDWAVRKPYAWTDYDSMPHVTLHPSMKKYYNEEVEVTFGELSHFTEGRSRWVVVHAKLPPKFKCEYECHLSIGQQRFK